MARPRKGNALHLPRYVHEKHGAFFYVRDNKWNRLGDNYADAMVEYAKWMGAKVGPIADAGEKAPELMFVDLLARAMPHICKGLKPRTINAYTSSARKVAIAFADVPAAKARAKHAYEICEEFSDAPSTANGMLTILRQMMIWAVRHEHVEFDPFSTIENVAYNTRDRYLKHTEYAAIYNKAPERLQIVMELCLYSGQRIGDVLTIQEDQLSDEGIAFHQEKGDAKLIVNWGTELRSAVTRAKAMRKAGVVQNLRTRFLLLSRANKSMRYNTIRDEWLATCAAAGIEDANLHDLRAKAATDMYLSHGGGEVGLRAAQALLGHQSTKMTWRYIRKRLPNHVAGLTRSKVVA